jgi:hypothetical protein
MFQPASAHMHTAPLSPTGRKAMFAVVTSLMWMAGAPAFADCAADSTVADVRKAYARGQSLEQAGQRAQALSAYVAAQDYTCEANPVETDAARRGAVLGKLLGSEAEANGKLLEAFELYDAGGHYQAADRMLVGALRASGDDIALYTKARQVFQYRNLPAFVVNNKVRLAATAPYQFDAKLLADVVALPAQAATRALQAEAQVFNEQYLRDRVQLIEATPTNPLDMAGWQRAQEAQQAFARKWATDPIEASLKALDRARMWTANVDDASTRSQLERSRLARLDERAALLHKQYAGAPASLERASDYYGAQSLERAAFEAKLVPVKAQARTQGAAAEQAGRLALAAQYYELAGDEARAQAVRNRGTQQVQKQMAPSIEQAQKQAEEMRRAFSDPAKVEAMRKRAQEAQRSIQQNRPTAAQNAASVAELEKELGL